MLINNFNEIVTFYDTHASPLTARFVNFFSMKYVETVNVEVDYKPIITM